MKKFFILNILLVILISFFDIKADEDNYFVYNYKDDNVSSFNSFYRANEYFENNKDSYSNMVISKNGKIIKMEYGVISFNNESDTKYYSIDNNKFDYLNGLYSNDALYLSTDYDNNRIYFYLNNIKGYVDINDVTLIPYTNELVVSSYDTLDNVLYHNIKSTMNHNYYSYSIKLIDMPDFMDNNSKYFSYDGKYFYNDFYLMSYDILNNTKENSINEIPLFNYYQYISFKSDSVISKDDLSHYINNILGYDCKLTSYTDNSYDFSNDKLSSSNLFNSEDYFISSQLVNKVNSTMLISSAINESNYGKSFNAYLNNLYSMSSYTFSKKGYKSIQDCINSFSNSIINKYYGNFHRSNYYGTYYGDLKSGLSADYSLDVYYGEKCASYYYQIDKALGYKDLNRYHIAYINDEIQFYSDYLLQNKLSKLNKNEIYLTLLSEYNDSYSVMLENNQIVYIDKNDVLLVNDNLNNQYSYIDIEYDFNGGSYYGFNTLNTHVYSISDLYSIKPELDGYDFIEYKFTDNKYVAQYKKIKEVVEYYTLDDTLEYNEYFDLKDKSILVVYEDDYSKIVPLSDCKLEYINTSEENALVITYCGISIKHNYSYVDSKNNLLDKLDNYYMIGNYRDFKQSYLNSNIMYDYESVKKIDQFLQNKNDRNYIMNNITGYDISFTGLDLSLPDKKTFSLFEDSYYINTSLLSTNVLNKYYNTFKNYGFDIINGIDINFNFNYEVNDLAGQCFVSINLDNKETKGIYSVYQLKDDGLYKRHTSQSENCITFEISESGNYIILYKNGFNNYDLKDNIENLTYDKTGIDNNKINIEFLLTIVLILTNFIGIVIYYLINDRKDNAWKGFKKSLQIQDTVLEEKQKS